MKIDLKGRDKLVVSGCSFTDGFNMAEKGSWAYYLSNMLGFELYNKARGGMGNEWILNSIIIFLQNNPKIRDKCIVGVGWSDFNRYTHSIKLGTKKHDLTTVQPWDFYHGGNFSKYETFGKIFYSDLLYGVYKTYLSIYHLITFCERWNIPYFGVDTVSPNKIDYVGRDKIKVRNGEKDGHTILDINDSPNFYRNIVNLKWRQFLFKNHLKVLEFDCMNDFISTNQELYQKGNEGHPNDVASKIIAESIYKQII